MCDLQEHANSLELLEKIQMLNAQRAPIHNAFKEPGDRFTGYTKREDGLKRFVRDTKKRYMKKCAKIVTNLTEHLNEQETLQRPARSIKRLLSKVVKAIGPVRGVMCAYYIRSAHVSMIGTPVFAELVSHHTFAELQGYTVTERKMEKPSGICCYSRGVINVDQLPEPIKVVVDILIPLIHALNKHECHISFTFVDTSGDEEYPTYSVCNHLFQMAVGHPDLKYLDPSIVRARTLIFSKKEKAPSFSSIHPTFVEGAYQ